MSADPPLARSIKTMLPPDRPAEPISFINGVRTSCRWRRWVPGLPPVSRCGSPCFQLQQEDRIVSPLDTHLGETREAEGVAVGLSTALSGRPATQPNQCSRPADADQGRVFNSLQCENSRRGRHLTSLLPIMTSLACNGWDGSRPADLIRETYKWTICQRRLLSWRVA